MLIIVMVVGTNRRKQEGKSEQRGSGDGWRDCKTAMYVSSPSTERRESDAKYNREGEVTDHKPGISRE